MSAVDIVTRLRKRHETEGWIDDPNVEVDAADEIERLRGIIEELFPYLLSDVNSALEMGSPPSDHEDDGCPDCEWYKLAKAWVERINSGEFRFTHD